jgi:serine/threonine protein kinase
MFDVGSLIDGRYRISCYVGCGGMGSVYKARHLQLDRDVAIKFLYEQYCVDVASVRRFQREARIVSGLKHENIVTVHSFGAFQGRVYLAMEYLEGKSLRQLIETEGPMPLDKAMPLLLQICDAMSHAHESGVLHRDLKPDNVMIVEGAGCKTAKVVDFGLARLADATRTQRLTQTGVVVGDPRYMSPEQCHGEVVDVRADIYSFGCLVCEVLTGRVPFEDDDPVAVMQKQVSSEPAPFARLRELPSAIESIAFTAMSKDKCNRYQSFDDLAVALRQFCQRLELNVPAPKCKRTILRWTNSQSIKRAVLVLLVVACVLAGATTSLIVKPDDWSMLSALLRYQFPSGSSDKIRDSLVLGSYYERRGNDDEALPYYEQAKGLAMSAQDLDSLVRCNSALGRIFGRQHRQQDASRVYGQSLSDALKLTVNGRSDERLFDEVQSALEDYAKLQPQAAVVIAYQFADYYSAHNASEQAQHMLQTVSHLGTSDVRSHTLLALGKLALNNGDKTRAQSYFLAATNMTQDPFARANYLELAGTELLKSQDFGLALQYFGSALKEVHGKKDPYMSRLYSEVGLCYVGLRRFDLAVQNYKLAVSTEEQKTTPNVSQMIISLDGLAQSEYHNGNCLAAEKALRQELTYVVQQRDDRQLAQVYCGLGDALTCSKKYDDASAAFKRALSTIDASPRKTELSETRQSIEQYYLVSQRKALAK